MDLESHVRAHLDTWMFDVTVGAVPAAAAVRRIDADLAALGSVTWEPGLERRLPRRHHGGITTARDMLDDLTHPMWAQVCAHMATVTGPWLHPQTAERLGDPHTVATGDGALLLGCVAREHPEQGRRFRADVDVYDHDLGVIAFPLRVCWILDAIEAGLDAPSAATAAVAAAVAESGVHEAVELFQDPPGVPVLDPHLQPLGTCGVSLWGPAGRFTLEIWPGA
jgi:hypothetical protein